MKKIMMFIQNTLAFNDWEVDYHAVEMPRYYKIATNEPPTIYLTNVKKVIKEALYLIICTVMYDFF